MQVIYNKGENIAAKMFILLRHNKSVYTKSHGWLFMHERHVHSIFQNKYICSCSPIQALYFYCSFVVQNTASKHSSQSSSKNS